MRRVFFSEDMVYTPFQAGQTRDGLAIPDVSFVSTADEADVICARTLPFLAPYLHMNKALVIWTHEPVQCVAGGSSFEDIASGKTIHIMTVYNGEALPSPLAFFPFKAVDRQAILDSIAHRSRFCLILATFRARLDRVVDGRNVDLTHYRQRMALHLQKQHDACDVYGKNWPADVPVVEESRGGDWRRRKSELLADYQFNLACENTVAQNYISEKVWDSILGGTVTVYFGKGTGIEGLLRPQSYIDPADFTDFDDLYRHMQGLSLADRIAIAASALEDHARIMAGTTRAEVYREIVDRFAQKVRDIC
jgi:alpha(1,3/1,4) fucosyltransferase